MNNPPDQPGIRSVRPTEQRATVTETSAPASGSPPLLTPTDLRYLTVHLDAEEAALMTMKNLLENIPLHDISAAEVRSFRQQMNETATKNE
ncbi:MAG: hypothetical protein KDA96_23405, partial [Planctomycetaceae bacterium]|nr:hypothetical protein [Planctomycetaceae bacterium]